MRHVWFEALFRIKPLTGCQNMQIFLYTSLSVLQQSADTIERFKKGFTRSETIMYNCYTGPLSTTRHILGRFINTFTDKSESKIVTELYVNKPTKMQLELLSDLVQGLHPTRRSVNHVLPQVSPKYRSPHSRVFTFRQRNV
jgi:hypothetical protein